MKKTVLAREDPVVNTSTKSSQPSNNLYSSIVGSLQSQSGADSKSNKGDNPFKYSKEEVLQVYTSLDHEKMQAPLDFERHEEITAKAPVQPVNLTAPSEMEKQLLSGNISSDIRSRRTDISDHRSNDRRNVRNGHRETKKPDAKRADAQHDRAREAQAAAADSKLGSSNESGRDAFAHATARNTSRLATMGVFDTTVGPESSRWKDEKEDDVLKEAMRQDESNAEVERLTDMYSNQSLSGMSSINHNGHPRSYGEQTYNPMSNGMPDLLNKPSMYGAQQSHNRGSFLGSTPSPGLQTRSDQHAPMTTRIMVMPDKLKWQYRDPTGQNQGPFSGLEMHDWYKAGFFQPNLLVKREEDDEFEPLSILVRRIGNQREPFLVPLPSRVTTTIPPKNGTQDAAEWSSGQGWSGGTTATGGQPPFPQSFPSFGTTLTAEQQNALERRKQEEQYLMHRQREFLQQQQMVQQMNHQRMHHQPGSYGGQQGGYYQMDRRSSPFSGADRQGSTSSTDNSGQAQLGNAGWSGYYPQSGNAARGQYQDFGAGIFDIPKSEVAGQKLRDQVTSEVNVLREDSGRAAQLPTFQERAMSKNLFTEPVETQTSNMHEAEAHSVPSSSFYSATHAPVREVAIPEPFVDSPIATHLVEQEAVSKTPPPVEQEPAISTPSQVPVESPAAQFVAAPWALNSATRSKSFRDIQESEAQVAAKRDAEKKTAAKAAEKAAQEARQAAASAAPVVAPLNLQWANKAEQDVASGFAAWKASASSSRKTLAQIQQEEENVRRSVTRQSAKAQAQDPASLTKTTSGGGTRYADSATKNLPNWTTVGPGGKVGAMQSSKIESLPKTAPVIASTGMKSSSILSHESTNTNRATDPMAISPEFYTWAQGALKNLNPGVNFTEFFQLLLSLSTDGGSDTREIISDSIYANSATIDGRRFADEFCRRRKEDLKNKNGLNKSIAEHSTKTTTGTTNGWNDVVKSKKQEVEEDQWNANFKVQTGRNPRRKK